MRCLINYFNGGSGYGKKKAHNLHDNIINKIIILLSSCIQFIHLYEYMT